MLDGLISTHSARGGGDSPRPLPRSHSPHFNPLRPRGRRREDVQMMMPYEIFQPTPPVGAETGEGDMAELISLLFQPTPPVGAETENTGFLFSYGPISTHSARGGGDSPLTA